MIVVSDTSPINYLLLIGEVGLLPALFGRIAVPEAVRRELSHEGAADVVREWAAALPEWVERHASPDCDLDDLGPGERETIALAELLKAPAVLLDDGKARRAAEARGLVVIGTLAVLTRAADRHLIDLPTAIERLRHTSFRAKPARLRAILERRLST